jgi:hypothetical protein
MDNIVDSGGAIHDADWDEQKKKRRGGDIKWYV